MTTKERSIRISDLCDEHDCSDKIRKIHHDQYVNKRWLPHPPAAFVEWWKQRLEYKVSEVQPTPAWNCQWVQDEYMEAMGQGFAS